MQLQHIFLSVQTISAKLQCKKTLRARFRLMLHLEYEPT